MIIIEKNQSPKKEPKNTNDKLMAFIALPLLAVPTIEMQIAIVAVLTAVTVVMCIATLMFLFAMRKNNEEEEAEEETEETEEEPDELEDEEESDEDNESADDEESAPEEAEEEPDVEEGSEEEEVEETAEEEITEEETPYEEEAAVADEEENYEEETPEEETVEEENLEETAEEAYEETPEEEVVEEENIDDVAEEEIQEEEVPEETTEEESLDDISEGETYEEETEEEETTEEESLDDADEEESFEEIPKEEEKEDDDSGKDGGFGFALPFGWRRGVNKKEIADYLDEEFDGKVKTNRRQNFTKTGLPLADTHYVINNGKKECFAYVYEKEDSKFLIVKATDDVVEKYSKSTLHCTPSNFPKASEQWYKLTVDDDDEKGTEKMYDMLSDVVSARYEKHSEESAAADQNIDMTEVLSEVAISDVSDDGGDLSKSENSDVSPKSVTMEAGEDDGMFESAEPNGEDGEIK